MLFGECAFVPTKATQESHQRSGPKSLAATRVVSAGQVIKKKDPT